MTAAGTVVFAGGGTGGHIYPALAIADHLRTDSPDLAIRVLCSDRSVDESILTKERVPFTALPAKPPGLRPRALLRFIGSWGGSLRATRSVLQEAKRNGPVTLVAMGGFVCPPAVRAARVEGVPVTLVNLDAVPGRANRWVARRAARSFTAASVSESWQQVTPIVRAGLTEPIDPGAARRSFGLAPDQPTLLITGGSQGARSINDLMVALLDTGMLSKWQVIHQTGAKTNPEPISAIYKAAGVRAWVGAYLDDMPSAWAAAELSIGRCGAGTVAEAWATRTPTVFFPYPYHADNHQRFNAQPLVDAASAVVLEDRIDADANLARHREQLEPVLQRSQPFEGMVHAAASLRPVDGASVIASALAGILRDQG